MSLGRYDHALISVLASTDRDGPQEILFLSLGTQSTSQRQILLLSATRNLIETFVLNFTQKLKITNLSFLEPAMRPV